MLNRVNFINETHLFFFYNKVEETVKLGMAVNSGDSYLP